MTRLISFLSVVLLVASLPDTLAGPACSKKHYKQSDCLSKCRHGWGWSGKAMGSDRWGPVMKKMPSNETLDDVLHRACGCETSSTITPTNSPVGDAATGSVTLPSTTSSSVTTLGTTNLTASTSSATPSFSSSSVLNTSVSTRHHVSPTSTKPFTTFTTPAAPPKTSSAPLSHSPTTSSARRTTTSNTPAPTTTTATSSGGGSSSSDIDAYLSAHNTVRAQHGAAPLTWSNDLASKAQTWTNKCVFKHSGGSLGPFGENLAAGTGSSYGIQTAIKSWTDEVSEYDPSHPTFSHFTQVVWKSTTQVGCAVQLCDGIFSSSFGKAKYYVCEYFPAGNIIGEFAQNVQV